MSESSEYESSPYYGGDNSPSSPGSKDHDEFSGRGPNPSNTMQTSMRDHSTSRTSFSPRLKELLLNELKAPTTVFHCIQHHDEELQFYCIDDNRLLCTECVVTGNHTGHEVLNFKKATGQIMQRLDDLLQDMENRIMLCDAWNTKVESRKEDLGEIISDYKNKITLSMNELHRKIEAKQEKLLQEADQLHIIKMQEIGAALQAINNRQDEIITIKDTIQEKIKELEEPSICQYYSTRVNMIRGFINDEGSLQSLIKPFTDDRDFEEGFSLDKFQDEIQLIMLQLRSLKGIEDERELADLARYSPAKITNNFPTFNTSENEHFPKHEDEENQVKARSTITSNLTDHINKINPGSVSVSLTKPQNQTLDEDCRPLSFRTRSQNIYESFDKILQLRKKSEQKLKAAIVPMFSNGGGKENHEEKTQRRSLNYNSLHRQQQKDENPFNDYNLPTPSTGILTARKTTRRPPQLSVDCNRKSYQRDSALSAKTSYIPDLYTTSKLKTQIISAQLDLPSSSLLSPIWTRSAQKQDQSLLSTQLGHMLSTQNKKRVPISLVRGQPGSKSHSYINDSPGLSRTTHKWAQVFRSQLFHNK